MKKEFDKIPQLFLWQGASKDNGCYCLIKWGRVYEKKEFGGMRIINLRDFSQALMVKWWWMFYGNSRSRLTILQDYYNYLNPSRMRQRHILSTF